MESSTDPGISRSVRPAHEEAQEAELKQGGRSLCTGSMELSTDPYPSSPLAPPYEVADDQLWRITSQQLSQKRTLTEPPPEKSKCFNLFGGSLKKMDKYNKHQDFMLEEFGKLDELLIAEKLITPAMETEKARMTKRETFAINISNFANFSILVFTIFAAALSGSLALVASALDSFLDLMSGLILWFTSMQMKKHNPFIYPIGKQRMQPVGILVFSAVMASLGLQVLIISVQKLINKEKQVDLQGHKAYWVIVIMSVSIVVMFALALYCQTFKSKLVKAYADDHFFDGLTNVVGLASAILAAKFEWWIDPLGALLLAIYTIACWVGKIRKNIRLLVGKSAPTEVLQKITYLCWNFDERIQKIDTVRAYTCGVEYVAEVDIVLPREMQLSEAHDIGEGLQNKLESLPFVERAFVHVDYEVSHKPEHSV